MACGVGEKRRKESKTQQRNDRRKQMNEGLKQSHPDYIMSQAEEEAVTAIEEAGHNLEAVRAYRDNVGESYTPLLEWEDWIGDFEEAYQGEMDTREFAEQLADEFFDLNSPLGNYFDYEKWERDLFLGDYWENDGHIFRSM
jgi:antirestriction protein